MTLAPAFFWRAGGGAEQPRIQPEGLPPAPRRIRAQCHHPVAQGTPQLPGSCSRPVAQSAGLSLSLRVVSSSGTTSRTTRGTTPWTSWIAWRCSNTAYAIWSGSRPRRNASQERHREGSPSPSARPPVAQLCCVPDLPSFLCVVRACGMRCGGLQAVP